MITVFVVCAALGGSIMVIQIVTTLVGLGGEAFDVDLPDDLDGALESDLGLDAEMAFDTDGQIAPEVDSHIDSTWLFGVLSFRTIVAALAFFGLTGLAAESTGLSTFYTLAVAIAAGLAAMYGMYGLMLGMNKLKSEGTPRIQRALGRHATVYVSIPAHESAAGKVQLCLQNRTMEYLAMTKGEMLPPGTKVVVTDVLTPNTVEVKPLLEPERNNHD